jgi:hypothetical protein
MTGRASGPAPRAGVFTGPGRRTAPNQFLHAAQASLTIAL